MAFFPHANFYMENDNFSQCALHCLIENFLLYKMVRLLSHCFLIFADFYSIEMESRVDPKVSFRQQVIAIYLGSQITEKAQNF